MRSLTMYALAVCAFITPTVVFAQDQPGNDRVVLGKYAQAIAETKLYKNTDTKATVYYVIKEFEPLIVNPTKWDKWTGVVLNNGKTGYVLSADIAVLPYNVTSAVSRGSSSSRGDINRALDYSFDYIGTPYKFGGTSLQSGIDCSAFVKDVFDKIGVDLPRTAAEQYKVGKPVTKIEDLRPGDRLYFWDKKRGLIGHTGIFIGWRDDGGAYFIHSSSTNKGVATDDLRDEKWRRILVAARR